MSTLYYGTRCGTQSLTKIYCVFRYTEGLHSLRDGLEIALYPLPSTIPLMVDGLNILESLEQSKFDHLPDELGE